MTVVNFKSRAFWKKMIHVNLGCLSSFTPALNQHPEFAREWTLVLFGQTPITWQWSCRQCSACGMAMAGWPALRPHTSISPAPPGTHRDQGRSCQVCRRRGAEQGQHRHGHGTDHGNGPPGSNCGRMWQQRL